MCWEICAGADLVRDHCLPPIPIKVSHKRCVIFWNESVQL
jgi:hypothetical protein